MSRNWLQHIHGANFPLSHTHTYSKSLISWATKCTPERPKPFRSAYLSHWPKVPVTVLSSSSKQVDTGHRGLCGLTLSCLRPETALEFPQNSRRSTSNSDYKHVQINSELINGGETAVKVVDIWNSHMQKYTSCRRWRAALPCKSQFNELFCLFFFKKKSSSTLRYIGTF